MSLDFEAIPYSVLEIHSKPLSKWPLIILYELIFFGNLTYRWRLFPRHSMYSQ